MQVSHQKNWQGLKQNIKIKHLFILCNFLQMLPFRSKYGLWIQLKIENYEEESFVNFTRLYDWSQILYE